LFCCKDRAGFVKGVCVWRQGEKNSVRERERERGSKPGSGGAASAQNEAVDRRERLRRLALQTIDLAKDPYFMRNHLGSYECKLCLTCITMKETIWLIHKASDIKLTWPSVLPGKQKMPLLSPSQTSAK
jgi:hypothetical protein